MVFLFFDRNFPEKAINLKKLLIVFLISITSAAVTAQVWGHPGATWHYSYGLFSGGLSTIEYTSDATILGYPSQQLNVVNQDIYPQPDGTTVLGPSYNLTYFTRYSGDSVFWYAEGEFHLLYDFGASIGDSWALHETVTPMFSCDPTSVIEVTDTGTLTFNGMTLRYIDLNYVQGGFGMSGRAVERIGMIDANNPEMGYLFPMNQNCDPNQIVDFNLYNFSCYQDNAFGLYNVTNQDCDYLVTTASLDAVDSNQHKEILKLYDFLGREIDDPKHQWIIVLYSDGTTIKAYVSD